MAEFAAFFGIFLFSAKKSLAEAYTRQVRVCMLFLFSSLPSEAADARQLQEQRLHEALLRLAAGEIDAMSSLYENSKTAVFALALSILKNRQDAEDILHDTFVQLYRMADRYDRNGRPLAWILTMTRNLCLMQLRRKIRQKKIALGQKPDDQGEQSPGPTL